MRPALFSRERLIRFSDCDPAAIVFYPQYFVMFNGLVEDWFNEGLQVGYQRTIIERSIGLPTVRLEADFKAISKMGDQVLLALNVERLGSRSLTLQATCTGLSDGVVRMSMQQVLVFMSLKTYQSMEIPKDIHAAISQCMAASGSA